MDFRRSIWAYYCTICILQQSTWTFNSYNTHCIRLHVSTKHRLAEAVSKIQNALFSSQCFFTVTKEEQGLCLGQSPSISVQKRQSLCFEPLRSLAITLPLLLFTLQNELTMSLLFFPSMTYPVYLHTHPPVVAAGRHSSIAHHTPLHILSAETVRQAPSESSPDVYLACVSLCRFNCSAFWRAHLLNLKAEHANSQGCILCGIACIARVWKSHGNVVKTRWLCGSKQVHKWVSLTVKSTHSYYKTHRALIFLSS